VSKTEEQILKDVYNLCKKKCDSPKDIKILGQWNLLRDVFVIKHIPNYTVYELTLEAILSLSDCDEFTYTDTIKRIACHLLLRPTTKENNEMYKKLSDTEYENTVAAIADEYEDKKRDAKAEYNEKLAKAEADKVTANIREEADLWAYDLYARYNALHESGFAEELSIELLKLYISSKK
jgi:hypothetical protein